MRHPSTAAPVRHRVGFTLLEVLIVVAIIGILAAIAIPQYTDYQRRAQVEEATTALSTLKVQMEQYYQDNRSYCNASAATACTAPACGVTTGGTGTTVPDTAHFSISCTSDSASQQTFTGTATGKGGLTTGLTYTIDQQGNRTTTCTKCAWGPFAVTQNWVTGHQ